MKSPSKTKRLVYGAIGGLGIFAGAAGLASAATSQTTTPTTVQAPGNGETAGQGDTNEAPTYKSSVQSPESPEAAENGVEQSDAAEAAQLAPLAKVSETDASAAATAAVPGTVAKVELSNENGNVVYDVEVKAADGTKTDVTIDAGNGKVLAQETEADEHDGEDNGGADEGPGTEVNDAAEAANSADD